MRNWSTDTSKLDKQSSAYKKWRLEELINFGLDGEKLAREQLEKYLDDLNIDSDKKKYLQFLLRKNA